MAKMNKDWEKLAWIKHLNRTIFYLEQQIADANFALQECETKGVGKKCKWYLKKYMMGGKNEV